MDMDRLPQVVKDDKNFIYRVLYRSLLH